MITRYEFETAARRADAVSKKWHEVSRLMNLIVGQGEGILTDELLAKMEAMTDFSKELTRLSQSGTQSPETILELMDYLTATAEPIVAELEKLVKGRVVIEGGKK